MATRTGVGRTGEMGALSFVGGILEDVLSQRRQRDTYAREDQVTASTQEREMAQIREQQRLLAEREEAARAAAPSKPQGEWKPTTFDEWKAMKDYELELERAKAGIKKKDKEGPTDAATLNFLQDRYGIGAGDEIEGDLDPYAQSYASGGLAGLQKYEAEHGRPKFKETAPDETKIFNKAMSLLDPWNVWYRNRQADEEGYGTPLKGAAVPPADPRTGEPISQELAPIVADVVARQNKKVDDAVTIAIGIEVADRLAGQTKLDPEEALFPAPAVRSVAQSMGIGPLPDMGTLSLEHIAGFVAMGLLDEEQAMELIRRLQQAAQVPQRLMSGAAPSRPSDYLLRR